MAANSKTLPISAHGRSGAAIAVAYASMAARVCQNGRVFGMKVAHAAKMTVTMIVTCQNDSNK